jgi:hypothetical protein
MKYNFEDLMIFYTKKFNLYLVTTKNDKELTYQFLGEDFNCLNITILLSDNWVNLYLGNKQIIVVEDLDLFNIDENAKICKLLDLLFNNRIEEIEFYTGDKLKCVEFKFYKDNLIQNKIRYYTNQTFWDFFYKNYKLKNHFKYNSWIEIVDPPLA